MSAFFTTDNSHYTQGTLPKIKIKHIIQLKQMVDLNYISARQIYQQTKCMEKILNIASEKYVK